MKATHFFLFLIMLFVAIGCGNPSKQTDKPDDGTTTENPNEALYNQVMDIHDEVMPKMEDLYRLKKQLQEKIANSPKMTEEEVKRIQKRIVQVDSVSKLMMDWMHEFNPLPDSADQEESREYLESEMEKIKKVKDAMLETLEKGEKN